MDNRLDVAASYYRAANEARRRSVVVLHAVITWLPLAVMLGVAGHATGTGGWSVAGACVGLYVLATGYGWYRARLELERLAGDFKAATTGKLERKHGRQNIDLLCVR